MTNTGKTPAAAVAFGGVFAALAVMIMSIGGLIPIATYVCPMLCAFILQIVLHTCGKKIGWTWYAAVAILGLMLSPDKEAAGVFLFIGYYPLVKPKLDRTRFPLIWKLALFNCSTSLLYYCLLHIFGLEMLQEEFSEMSAVFLSVLLVMGNVTFFLMDRLLGMRFRRIRKKS